MHNRQWSSGDRIAPVEVLDSSSMFLEERMFKRMPKIFWITLALIYGWFFLFFFLEITVKGFPLAKFMGMPACFFYNAIIGCWVLNLLVAVILYRSQEKREEQLEAGAKGAS
jgi:hypothetical protein